MSDKKDNEIIETAKALNIAGVVPDLYKDAVQPAAKEIGKGLAVVAKTINVALSPIAGLVWGYEQIEKYVKDTLEKKLKNKDPEKITSPPPNIAGPLLESLKYTAYQEELRNMYLNLLATSMDKDVTEKAHPSFVEIIRQLSPDEAKILYYIPTTSRYPDICMTRVDSSWAWGQIVYEEVTRDFVNICKEAEIIHADLAISYLDNLRRLLILEYRQEVPGKKLEERQGKIEIETDTLEIISVTKFGQQFISSCVLYDEQSVIKE
ncbi:MAG: hypothetical protein C0620_04445 [Desulfuromonas sp.]|nr:MAG: hypothetical protein C0620_04445 [Desulfuromonas sp.]